MASSTGCTKRGRSKKANESNTGAFIILKKSQHEAAACRMQPAIPVVHPPSFKGLFWSPSDVRILRKDGFSCWLYDREMNAAAPHRDRFSEFCKCLGPDQLEGFPFPVARFPCRKSREDNSLKNSCWLESLPWGCTQQGRSCDINKCLCGHSASGLYNPSVPSRSEHNFMKFVWQKPAREFLSFFISLFLLPALLDFPHLIWSSINKHLFWYSSQRI